VEAANSISNKQDLDIWYGFGCHIAWGRIERGGKSRFQDPDLQSTHMCVTIKFIKAQGLDSKSVAWALFSPRI